MKFWVNENPNERPERSENPTAFFKFVNGSDVKLVRHTLEDNGFKEIIGNWNPNWSIMWSNTCYWSEDYHGLTRFQRLNHFPKISEVCWKDFMYNRIVNMQTSKGKKHFDFVPKTYVLPLEKQNMNKNQGLKWIVKPSNSCQGWGIFITSDFGEIPENKEMVVSQYIDNPLLINGFKFDLWVYVAITCFNPLWIYVYNEGMGWFATMKYNSSKNSWYKHLTNFSINKKNANFVASDQAEESSKWTMTMIMEHLEQNGMAGWIAMLKA